jgi:hypothetical protein
MNLVVNTCVSVRERAWIQQWAFHWIEQGNFFKVTKKWEKGQNEEGEISNLYESQNVNRKQTLCVFACFIACSFVIKIN